MNALIVVHRYPPDQSIPARRWGNLVQALQKLGVECTVLVLGSASSSQGMGGHGERVFRFAGGTGTTHTGATQYLAHARQRCGLVLQRVFGLHLPLELLSLARKSRRFLCDDVILAANTSQVVISTYGPLFPLVLGRYLADRFRKPWIADIRDSFEMREETKISFLNRLNRRLERKVLLSAKCRLTIGRNLADYLAETYTCPFQVIYNGWVDADLVGRPTSASEGNSYVLYAGSLYSHQLPALSAFARSLARFPDLSLRIRLLRDFTAGSLTRMLAQMANRDQVCILPPVEETRVLDELRGSLAVLVVESLSEEDRLHNATITGKLLPLLASGMPGIAVSSKNGEIRNFVDRIPNWHGVNSVDQCCRALAQIRQKTGSGDDNRTILEEYHMDNQALALRRLLP